ncbi:MAG: hydroxyethylthiazole kinase [Lachnospiraceae bacterium]|nr:hydroxyethylthiazole kinase [Lachnospiraceae bacterium]
MLAALFENVRTKRPLIHTITTYVTANDCANMVIACGAAPIMADDPREAAEVTSICAGLDINLGTLTERKAEAMRLAGMRSNELDHPVALDPVGVGASSFRRETVAALLKAVRFTVIRGNISEIRTIAKAAEEHPRGVDADKALSVTEETLASAVDEIKGYASKLDTVIAMTGAIDIVADSSKAYVIRNGHPMLSDVTGTGCQLSALVAAFCAANRERPLEAAAAAVCAMGLAGEIAHGRMTEQDGNATYRNYVIDAIYTMTPEELARGAKYEIR